MLMIANTIVMGLLFLIWKKSDWMNFLIKAALFALFVFNVLAVTGRA